MVSYKREAEQFPCPSLNPFHLYGMNLGTTREQEVNLVVMCRILRPSVIEKFVARCGKHLSHYIFIYITKISAKFVIQQLLKNHIR